MTRVADNALGASASEPERRLVGWCIIDSAAFIDARNAGLTGAALGNPGLAVIFGAMQRLAEGEAPAFSASDVIEELRRSDELDAIGGAAAIHALIDAAHGTSYNGLVRKVMAHASTVPMPPESNNAGGAHVSADVALVGGRQPAPRAWSALRTLVSDQLCGYADFLALCACDALLAERISEARELARITRAIEAAATVIDRGLPATPIIAADRRSAA